MRQVFHFGERLEDVFALLLGDTATGVADDELVGVRTTFLEVQPYFSSSRGCTRRRFPTNAARRVPVAQG